MIERLNLRTQYHFKQAQIEVTPLSGDVNTIVKAIQTEIKEKIVPAVLKLESENLINGFYFIKHEKIDLRLSCDSWDEKKEDIKNILKDNGIPDDLTDYARHDDEFDVLNDNSLEFISRLIMGYLMIEEKATTPDHVEFLKKIPNQWFHYVSNLYGLPNYFEATNYFNEGFFQLSQALKCRQCDLSGCENVIQWLKNRADEVIGKLRQGQYLG